MSIPNITRINTIDEWRIQTNQSANAINNIETGNYTKSNGILSVTSNGSISITAEGTPLSVSNAALFSTDVTVGKNLVLGSRPSETGNLTVGSNVSILGKNNSLYVANSATINKNLQVTENITTNNVVANSNISVYGTTNTSYLIVNSSQESTSNVTGSIVSSGGAGIGKSLFVSGNVSFTGDAYPDSSVLIEFGSPTSNTSANVRIRAGDVLNNGSNASLLLEGNGVVTGNIDIGSGLISTSTTTGALRVSGGLGVTANIHVSHLNATHSLVAETARISSNATATHFISSGSVVTENARITSNTTSGNVISSGSLVADNARITSNTTGAHFVASGSVVAENARITSNTTGAHFVASGSVVAENARITANITTGNLVSSTSVVSPVGRFTSSLEATSNSLAGITTAGGLGVSRSAFISGNLTVRGDAAGAVNTSVLVAIGDRTSNSAGNVFIYAADTSLGGANGSLTVQGNGTITGNLTLGSGLESTSKTSVGALKINGGVAVSSNIHGNAVYDNGNRVARTASATAPISTTLNSGTGDLSISHDTSGVTAGSYGSNIIIPVYVVNTTGHITGAVNTTIRSATTDQTGVVQLEDTLGGTSTTTAPTVNHVTAANTRMQSYVDVANTRMQSYVDVANTRMQSYVDVANTNMKNYVDVANTRMQSYVDVANTRMQSYVDVANTNLKNYTDSTFLKLTSSSQTITGGITVTGDSTVQGKMTVAGDFILNGDVLYDTDTLTISSVVPVTTTSGAYFGVFRGATSGGVDGGVGGVNSTANAYIRWNASSNTWQIRDVFNIDSSTSYKNILTTNSISSSIDSTSTTTALSSLGAKTISDNIVTANTKMQSYVDVANTKMQSYVDVAVSTANTKMQSYVDVANTKMQSYVDVAVSTANTKMQSYVDVANTNMKNYVDVANTNLKNYTDSSFLKITSGGSTQAIGTDVTFSGNVIVSKNLTISGIVTTINTVELNIGDNEIVLNSDLPNSTAPSQNAGIIINRGSSTNTYLRWNETHDVWEFFDGTTSYRIPKTTTDLAEGTNLYHTTSRAREALSATSPISYSSGTGVFSHDNSTVTAGDYGNASSVGVFRVDSRGHLTFAGNTAISISSAAVSGLATSATTDTTNATNITSGTLTSARLPASGVTIGTYGGPATVGAFTVDSTGRITSAAQQAIAITSSAVSGLATSATTDTSNATNITSGTLNSARLPASGAVQGNYGSSTSIPRIVVDSTGRITAVANLSIAFPAEADTLATVTSRGSTTATAVTLTNATEATSKTTGALIVTGGIGVSKNVHATALYDNGTRVARSALGTAPISLSLNAGTGALSASHDTSGVSAGTYGTNRRIPIITVNSTGHITSLTTETVNSAAFVAGTYGSSSQVPVLQIDDTGFITGISTSSVTLPSDPTFYNLAVGRSGAFNDGNLNLGDLTASEARLAYVNNNKARILVKPSYDINGTGTISSADVSVFNQILKGITDVDSAANVPFVMQHANNLSTGIMVIPNELLAASVGNEKGGGVIITGGTTSTTSNVRNYIRVGAATNIMSSAEEGAGIAIASNNDIALISRMGSSGRVNVTASIVATGEITSYFSDDRLKDKLGNIENALDKVKELSGFFYKANETAKELGYTDERKVGVSAQQVKKVLPEVVTSAPIDSQYMTVHYERLVPLLIEAIKELDAKLEQLKNK
jgi:hypothetical protein